MMKETARIIKADDYLSKEENLKELKEHVNNNKLIAFPTETVYGLGGNSLNESSLKKIFEMKKRPTTDPIISHVFNLSQAFEQLYEINIFEKYIIYILNKKFWPGPLSIIAKAKKELPLILTAGTRFCAVRIPNNDIAKQLIKICEFPIAAPSANKFQHISPTNALHVWEEFQNEDLLIFDGGQCEIGIESTVVKLVKHWRRNKEQKEKRETKKGNEEDVDEEDGEEEEEEEEEEEVFSDKEYGIEKEIELKRIQDLISLNSDVTYNGENKFVKTVQKIHDFLQLVFYDISNGNKSNTYVYNQLIKYKTLYQYSIVIYRRGKYTKPEIENVLKTDELLKDIKVKLCKKIKFKNIKNSNEEIKSDNTSIINGINKNDAFVDVESKIKNKNISNKEELYFSICKKELFSEKEDYQNNNNSNFVCPGMMLTHYSPSVSTYMAYIVNTSSDNTFEKNKNKTFHWKCNECVLLDIGGSMDKYKSNFLKYINIYHDPLLSETHNINYTTKQFFLCLREAEKCAIDLKGKSIIISITYLKPLSEKWLSLFDRIFRAASGKELLFFGLGENIILCNS